ncbi:hypothetical protein [Terasakiella pusilla]|uniref:hypothetical protein n=1 Tax=Terasakiella pusilla TaxID=64973 RepID=UPI003AA7C6FD
MEHPAQIGHNSKDRSVQITVRLFNSVAMNSPHLPAQLERTYPVGTTIDHVVRDLSLPQKDLFLILINGRDISSGRVGDLNISREIEDGDIVAFSGPVPYSYGYGAPVV